MSNALANIANGATQQPAILPVPRQVLRDEVCLSLGSQLTHVCTHRPCCLPIHMHCMAMRSLLPSACVSCWRTPAACSVCVRTGQRAVDSGSIKCHDTVRGLQLQPDIVDRWGTPASTARKKRAGTAEAAKQVRPGTVAAVLAQQLCCLYPPQLHEYHTQVPRCLLPRQLCIDVAECAVAAFRCLRAKGRTQLAAASSQGHADQQKATLAATRTTGGGPAGSPATRP
jgi:hypothetical protein